MSSNGSNPEMDTSVIHTSKAYSLEKLSFFFFLICIQTNLHSEHDGAFWNRICLKDFYAVRAVVGSYMHWKVLLICRCGL